VAKKSTSVNQATLVYLILVVLTLLAWLVTKTNISGVHVSMVILLVSLLKGHLVADYFMGLNRVNSFWRWAIVVWLLIPGVLIGYAFLI